jgi:hypothetical protein
MTSTYGYLQRSDVELFAALEHFADRFDTFFAIHRYVVTAQCRLHIGVSAGMVKVMVCGENGLNRTMVLTSGLKNWRRLCNVNHQCRPRC